MKFTINKKNSASIEVIFFDENKKLFCPVAMPIKELLETTLKHQVTEKTKLFHTFYKENHNRC